ncbi:MAG TPA: hypothetical protein VMV92_16870 [Streptosporangiaceae bacterium]|nr:hypothetical protein [Streptosporangiaceae bacterium]
MEHLEKLAAELAVRGFKVQLITPEHRLPSLAVANSEAAMLAESVVTGTDFYWWPWGQKIAPITDVTAAADIVARVLAPAPPP